MFKPRMVVSYLLVIISFLTANFTIAKNYKSLSPDKNVRLAVGYLNSSRLPMHNICIKDDKYFLGGIQKNVVLSYISDTNILAKNLNIDISANGTWKQFTAGAELEYLRAIEETSRSLTFTYQSIIKASMGLDNSRYYGTSVLNKGGLAAYKDGAKSFIKRCGDSYIQRLDLGAILSVSLRLNFNTKLQKQKFKAGFNGDVSDIVNASARIKHEIEKNNLQGTIDVIAMQRGGDPNRLDYIFNTNSDNNIIACSIRNLDACTKAINDIIVYSHDFAQQVKVHNNKLVANSLYPIDISTATIGSYQNNFGLNIDRIMPSNEVLAGRDKITSLYKKTNSSIKLINTIKNSVAYSHLGAILKNKIDKTHTDLKNNISMFTDGNVMRCFMPYDMQNCLSIYDYISNRINQDINIDKIMTLKDAYYFNSGYYEPNKPVILVPNNSGNMTVVNSYDLEPIRDNANNITLNPSYDYTTVSPKGEYTIVNSDGKNDRFKLLPSIFIKNIKQDKNGIGFFGKYLINVCRAGKPCFILPYHIELIPF